MDSFKKDQHKKLQNKLDFIVKLGDFGLAKYMEDNNFLQSYCGTPITMAIEILKREKYNEKCDIWSMGVIIYQMLYGYPPFNPKKGGNINDLINLIEKNEIKLPDEVKVSNEAKDLIKKMLVIDPEKRISFQDFFQHPWISVKQKDSKQEKEEYQTLLKSAYNSKSSQGDSNKGSKSSQKNQNQNEEKKLDDFSNLNPKMFMHSSVEDEKIAVNFTADQVNEYLGMTIRQKIRNNFDKYMKFVEEFLEMIEEARKIGNYQILFLGSLFVMRNSFVMFMNKLEIDVENKNIEFQLPYIQEYQDKLKEVCNSLVPNLQNKQILEEELNEDNELNIQKYKLYLNLIKLLKKKVSIVQKYEISINKYTKDILDLIDQEKIQKDYLLTDQEINQSTFSRQIFDLFEFESQSGEKQKFQIISQKELEQQQNYLIQRIQYVKNKSQISDMEGTGNEGQKAQLAEQGQILQENIFQKKQNTNQQTNQQNLDDNGYDLDGFDPNYKM
ncbi:Protein kinase-like domain [Pseudocohnilembus persalinus]|uniref:Protein kinase-like domain n=1 Tax=Pseudocohnilembus persalinus TaxID=266149 RepID=A0A0V0QTF9_PSEPJ|nr:Protein kinase-like domain [Pseudocohnilembus persalinus]|eukprot:KRX05524.1 Protein kinase-like domain [Pseudocohnilembus persalinus]